MLSVAGPNTCRWAELLSTPAGARFHDVLQHDRVSIFYAGRVVDSGARQGVLQSPRHPYPRRALLDALPHPEAAHERALVAIAGAPPTPGSIPAGCAFHPRCAYLRDSCRSEVPELVDAGGRLLACPVDPLAGS